VSCSELFEADALPTELQPHAPDVTGARGYLPRHTGGAAHGSPGNCALGPLGGGFSNGFNADSLEVWFRVRLVTGETRRGRTVSVQCRIAAPRFSREPLGVGAGRKRARRRGAPSIGALGGFALRSRPLGVELNPGGAAGPGREQSKHAGEAEALRLAADAVPRPRWQGAQLAGRVDGVRHRPRGRRCQLRLGAG